MENNARCDEYSKKFPGSNNCFTNGTVAEENNKKFIIDNTKLKEIFCKIKVDACLIHDNSTKKCDYVFIRCTNKDFYFVELKGTDIFHGYEQIRATIDFFKSKIDIQKVQIYGYIVSSSVPNAANQKFRKIQLDFKKNIGKELKRKTKQFIKYIDQ